MRTKGVQNILNFRGPNQHISRPYHAPYQRRETTYLNFNYRRERVLTRFEPDSDNAIAVANWGNDPRGNRVTSALTAE